MSIQREPRHKARHFAMQAIYQWQMTGDSPSEIEQQFIEDQPLGEVTDRGYFHDLLAGTVAHVEEIDAAFMPYLSRDIESLDVVDKAIIRLAVYELLYRTNDVPFRVVINEAIILAKEFAAQDSHKFVNGVLDKVVKHTLTQKNDSANTSSSNNSDVNKTDEKNVDVDIKVNEENTDVIEETATEENK